MSGVAVEHYNERDLLKLLSWIRLPLAIKEPLFSEKEYISQSIV